jgi:Fe2+ transport system protein FeoA
VSDLIRLDQVRDIPDMTITDDTPLLDLARHWPTVNLADPQYAIPPDPPAIAGLLYEGKRHVASGPQESAKTLIAYHLLLLALREGQQVAVVDLEMGPVATRRMLSDLGATDDELGTLVYTEPTGPPSHADLERIAVAEVRYVLIDAAAGAFDLTGLDDNSRKDAEAWARQWVQPLFSRGIATIVLDHVTKNVEGRGKYAIGSERKTGGADVHLGFEALKTLTRGGTGLVKITAHKDRGAYLQRPTAAIVELASDPDTHQITITYKAPEAMEDGPVKHTIYAERVSKALEANDGQPMSQRQLVEACQGGTDYIRDAANELVQAGYATVETGPRDAKNYTLTKPFRREEYDRATTAPQPRLGAVNHDRATAPPSLRDEARSGEVSDDRTAPPTAPDEINVWDPAIQHLLDDDIDF